MTRLERIYRIHDLLRSASRPIPMSRFMEELEASRNTVTRDFEYLRDILGAPLMYCRDSNGHQYDPEAPRFELPGFWMNPGELYALLACEQLLEAVQPGLVAHRLAPLKARVRDILGEAGHDASQISERIQVQPVQMRDTAHAIFDPIAQAVLQRRKLEFDYDSRSSNDRRHRTVSPQRLLHYRSNWYLLAQCETAADLRLFSLDRIKQPQLVNQTAQDLPPATLDHFAGSGFGIFGGSPKATAHLKFSTHAAQWVAEETWHPDQRGEWREDGYHLWVPYSDATELVMDVLRFGPEVEALGPVELRGEVIERIRKMGEIY
ncbi:YafY family protein [Marinobacteraceae bacterium S3BR75-40.1]